MAAPATNTDKEGFEYLDHTADVQLHSWGPNLQTAFENQIVAMSNYITDLDYVGVDESELEGHDLESLLYNFMDEWLFQFCTEFFICKEVSVTTLDCDHFKITSVGRGEIFERGRHVPGTEIKAITYSNMQIHQAPGRVDIYVIVDI
eukprot:CAMPEP_0177666180 /NCGR_PEP_ID=MMETSP0447-20121125/21446_1 /TAXON_ID=0 /ORGANISM="Stygamoeba regulata, Strain BSH-02190019" /LENGTH=146 /DNA_ID=CAMNT_0019172315 /DNA_START=20 /DNA_END=461 /DNA_ORIENTATION=-